MVTPPVVHRGSVIAAIASRDLAQRLEPVVGPLLLCHAPRDLPAMAGGTASRLLVYEAGAFPRELADRWLGTFCTAPNLPPLVVCWNRGTDALRECARLVAVTGCVLANSELNLGRSVLKCLARQRSTDVVSRLLHRIETTWGRPCHTTIIAALAIGDGPRSVAELASVTGTGVRALSHHCRALGMPRPVTLLGWSRAFHVLAAMEWDGESLRDVAFRTGDATPRDCADYVRYHTGRSPRSWLASGGVEALLDAFVERFSTHEAKDDSVPSLFLVPSGTRLEAVS